MTRARRPALIVAWVAALALLVAANQPWWQVAEHNATGTSATFGAAQGLGLAGLAGTLLLSWLSGWGSRLVAGLVAALHLGAGWLAAAASAPAELPLGVSEASAWAGVGWRWAYLGAAAIGLAASSELAALPARARSADDPSPTELDPWRALDAGEDPTLRGEGGESPRPGPE